MIKKRVLYVLFIIMFMFVLMSCSGSKEEVKIGVSLGVGEASRWVLEQAYMEEYANQLGAKIEVRLNKTDEPKTQLEDCYEMIDGGIDVLILTPRDMNNVIEIITYAREHKVKVINYSRVVLNAEVDLFVGYDTNRIGQNLGQYLSEMVYQGNYIILRGDAGDYNAQLLYEGAMKYILPIQGDINIILDQAVEGWSPEKAKTIVLEALKDNDNKVDAIFAPNDKIAGACAEALEELNITSHVVITGTDAELDAVRRIAAGKQDVTVYMDLKELADSAVLAAYNMATNQPVNVNGKFENGIDGGIDASLITGKLVTRGNIDKVLIESGHFTKEEVYTTQ